MSAFERIQSGIPQMDQALDSIRLGDNVVWRVTDLEEFRQVVTPFVEQARNDHRSIYYIRFASHPPLVQQQPGVTVIPVELSHRFETFTVDIHRIIESAGREAFYVFDCLSELQTAWATDLMMGNFFQVTCPFLFELDTVAYFPLIRGKHSSHAIGCIRETAQVFLDMYTGTPSSASGDPLYYVRPEKIWRRDSATMFLAHMFRPAEKSFQPILDGVQGSHFYQVLSRSGSQTVSSCADSWDRFFDSTRMRLEAGEDVTEACTRMCRIMMTRDERMRLMVGKHFQPEDYLRVRDHMIGTGMIGGKSCGMLLARKIIANLHPEISARLEPHDSFYVGSDVFYTYIVQNHFWKLRVQQRTEEGYFALAETCAEHFRNGRFSRSMREEFVRLLEYYGGDPFIVRSSSILEDGFGNAFAGKYESVFCSNTGTITERLEEFEQAIRTVYASTMCLSALDYRKRRGLDKRDEQMALLIQRVSGSHFGTWYLPCAAGVGYSYSPYRLMRQSDPRSGMLRLVMGLGTSAVDRTAESYPRLVSLDMPEKTAAADIARRHQFSQRRFDALDLVARSVRQLQLEDILELLPEYLKKLLLENDYDAERRLRERGIYRRIPFISCRGLVEHKALMQDMQCILQTLQSEYDYPVDTEFTINLAQNGEYIINLLQCRPLQISSGQQEIPQWTNIPKETVFLECVGTSMGWSDQFPVDLLVWVDPVGYYNMPYQKKHAAASAVGRINWHFRGSGKKLLLMVPGRIGTSSPELGVPCTFSDISEFSAIFELADSRAGYQPELSYGSHFFQDLVESGILYTAVFEASSTRCFHPEWLKKSGNRLKDLFPDLKDLEDIIRICTPDAAHSLLQYDMQKDRLLLQLTPAGETD
ncbi:MAG: PEP/pyruvate-binding domain-containing protein [Lachnospiraceae bacterium]|jgi:hypothetical protein|nr:PEP/pyruvate-binding domain-containing protein [Lachnospiraceae bacterium]MCI1657613.1 PEP/pyruvate-binding domain-containing protein [Lachnospiraceae bacterium]MCI2196028.1 PEP/pyruvate-binding domain-containing protein [Lachnospiraceae bacterium]